MRVLALDVGERRIGVALSDPSGVLATPLTAISRRDADSDVDEVQRLVRESDAGEIVVGLPVSLSGAIGRQAREVARFADLLAERIGIPVKTSDERFSTVQAERMLRESGIEPSRNRGRVDAAAAAVILQSYLDSRR